SSSFLVANDVGRSRCSDLELGLRGCWMADKHREPQRLTSKTATQISKKGVESSSYAAPIKHFAPIPASINRSDSRLPSFGQPTEFCVQGSRDAFQPYFQSSYPFTVLKARKNSQNPSFFLPAFQSLFLTGFTFS